MKITGKTYTINYDETTATMIFRGILRLENIEEGEPIARLLDEIADSAPEIIHLDFVELQLMNSAGLGIMTKFMFKMREQKTSKIILRASEKYFWQKDLIRGLQRFMPESELKWV
jgi:hypothetical protein